MEEPLDERMERAVRYVEGEMNAEERVAFERDLTQDPALVLDLDVARRTLVGLQALGEERLRKELHEADAAAEPGTPKKQWYWAAAAVLIGLVGTWMFTREVSPQQLADEFAISEPGLPVLMGTESRTMDAIMNAYKQDDITTAGLLLTSAVEKDPRNDTLQYFNGVLELREEGCASAEVWFTRVPTSSVFGAKAQFNMALCALRANDIGRARTILGDIEKGDDAQFAAKSRELLRRLENM